MQEWELQQYVQQQQHDPSSLLTALKGYILLQLAFKISLNIPQSI